MLSGVRILPLMAAVILMSLGVMLNLGGAITLSGTLVECERVSGGGICRVPDDPLRGTDVRVFPSGLLISAEVTYQNGGYGLELVTGLKRYPLLRGHLWREALDGLASQINTFIQQPEQSELKVRDTSLWYTIPMGILLLGLGGFCLHLALKPMSRGVSHPSEAAPLKMAAG